MFGFLGKGKNNSESGGSVSLDMKDPRDEHNHCLITGNLQIKGDVYFSGSLRIDGRVDGRVSTYEGRRGQVIISKGAVVNGPISATTVLADGLINGTMDVEGKLECRPNAIIRGHVTYGSMDIADGARIEARCNKRSSSAKQTEGQSTGTSFLATRPTKK